MHALSQFFGKVLDRNHALLLGPLLEEPHERLAITKLRHFSVKVVGFFEHVGRPFETSKTDLLRAMAKSSPTEVDSLSKLTVFIVGPRFLE